jgi:hypothetical protein
MAHLILNPSLPESVLGPKLNDGVGWLGLVWRQAGEVRIAPIRKIHNSSRLNSRLGILAGRLHNVQSIAVEEERVIPEQFAQLRNHGVIVGKGLAVELAQGSLDLCGSQFHRSLLLLVPFVALQRTAPRAITRRGSSHNEVVKRCRQIDRSRVESRRVFACLVKRATRTVVENK